MLANLEWALWLVIISSYVFLTKNSNLKIARNLIYAYLFWCILGYFFYNAVSIPDDIYVHINDYYISKIPDISRKICFLLAMLCLGSLCYLGISNYFLNSLRSHSAKMTVEVDKKLRLKIFSFRKYGEKFTSRLLVILILLLSIVLLVFGVGLNNLIRSTEYLAVEINELKMIGMILSPLGVLLAGYIFACSPSYRSYRFLIIILVIIVELIFLSIGTRRVALIPLLFLFGSYTATGADAKFKIGLVLAVALAIVFYFVALISRSLPEQGLLPLLSFLSYVSDYKLPYGESLLVYIVNTITNGLPLTGYVSDEPDIPIDYFLIAINPLPGQMAGWPDVVGLLRANKHVPYNALGELLNYGAFVGGGYFFILGMVVSLIQRVIDRARFHGDIFYVISINFLFFLFLIFSLQYNLRSATRLIYYALFLAFLYCLIFSVKRLGLFFLKKSYGRS